MTARLVMVWPPPTGLPNAARSAARGEQREPVVRCSVKFDAPTQHSPSIGSEDVTRKLTE